MDAAALMTTCQAMDLLHLWQNPALAAALEYELEQPLRDCSPDGAVDNHNNRNLHDNHPTQLWRDGCHQALQERRHQRQEQQLQLCKETVVVNVVQEEHDDDDDDDDCQTTITSSSSTTSHSSMQAWLDGSSDLRSSGRHGRVQARYSNKLNRVATKAKATGTATKISSTPFHHGRHLISPVSSLEPEQEPFVIDLVTKLHDDHDEEDDTRGETSVDEATTEEEKEPVVCIQTRDVLESTAVNLEERCQAENLKSHFIATASTTTAFLSSAEKERDQHDNMLGLDATHKISWEESEEDERCESKLPTNSALVSSDNLGHLETENRETDKISFEETMKENNTADIAAKTPIDPPVTDETLQTDDYDDNFIIPSPESEDLDAWLEAQLQEPKRQSAEQEKEETQALPPQEMAPPPQETTPTKTTDFALQQLEQLLEQKKKLDEIDQWLNRNAPEEPTQKQYLLSHQDDVISDITWENGDFACPQVQPKPARTTKRPKKPCPTTATAPPPRPRVSPKQTIKQPTHVALSPFPPKARSPKPLTVPKAFHLSTSQRCRPSAKTKTPTTSTSPQPGRIKSTSLQQGRIKSTRPLTIPKAPRFLLEHKYGKKSPSLAAV